MAQGCHDATGGTAGGQIGYRWQASSWVFGLEAQGNWADFKGSNVSLIDPAFRNQSRIDAFGLFTGQVGWAANNVLFYVKGGAAVTADRFRVFDVPTGLVVATTDDDTRWGGVIGAGLEFGFAPNWSAGVEYNHLFMQDRTHTFVDPTGAFLAHRSHPPGRRSRHRPRQLPLGRPCDREVLIFAFCKRTTEKAGLAPAFLFGCTARLPPPASVVSRIHSPRMWFFGDSILR